MGGAHAKKSEAAQDGPRVVFFIGKEKFEVTEAHLTVRVLLTDYAKEDPNENVLALKHGDHVEKFTDLDSVIELKNGMHFTVLHTGPTTVS